MKEIIQSDPLFSFSFAEARGNACEEEEKRAALLWPLHLALRTKERGLYHRVERQLLTYYLWYFANVASYLLKKEVEKIRL